MYSIVFVSYCTSTCNTYRTHRSQVISRNRVPGWLEQAMRVPDALPSLGCDLNCYCTRLASKSNPLNNYIAAEWFQEIGYPDGSNEAPGYQISWNHLVVMITGLVKRMAFRSQPGTRSLEITAKWFQEVGYPDGSNNSSGYSISWNHLGSGQLGYPDGSFEP